MPTKTNELKAIKLTDEFVKKRFKEHPHFSFNNWKVMYHHSQNVKNIALRIASNLKLKTDTTLIAVGSLLHDIGKTHIGSEKLLHYNHEDFNLQQAKPILKNLNISKQQLKKLQSIIAYKNTGLEQKIIKDADALALYYDKTLYTLYIRWATEKKLLKSIHRKLDKFKKLNFKTSKQIGKKWFFQMYKDWDKYTIKYLKISLNNLYDKNSP